MTNNTRKEKALNLRYKKAMLAELNYNYITNEIYDIIEQCDNVRYFIETPLTVTKTKHLNLKWRLRSCQTKCQCFWNV